MKKTIFILIAWLLLIGAHVSADDVKVDSSGNVTTGTSASGNLEVTGASTEKAIVGISSGTGGAGVYGENTTYGSFGTLGGYSNPQDVGVYGYSFGGWAGYFEGDARITGNLTVDGTLIGGENDPTVPASIKDGIDWLEVTGRPTGLDDGDDVGITNESDPTVATSVKDGVDWTELTGIPSGFADGTDNIGSSYWNQIGYSIYFDAGFVGAGTATPSYALHAVNPLPQDDDPAIYGEHAKTDYYGIGVKGVGLWKGMEGVVDATGSNKYYGVYGLASNGSGTGTTYGVYGRATSGNIGYGVYGETGMTGDFSGVYGINTYNDNYGYLGGSLYSVYGNSGIIGVYGENTNGNKGYLGGAGAAVYGESVGVSSKAGFFVGKVVVQGDVEVLGKVVVQGDVEVLGTNKVQVLEITGGADLSEQFNIRSLTNLLPAPGMVVSIDPQNPGDLIISTKSYDRNVAGIMSGAGGVSTGLLMGQKGSEADGTNPVALTGRVYCWADASKGMIQPGDLLTTSDTPGHAIKVQDYTKAQGAVIGKAMTKLEEGKGLILVLVSLQ